MAGAARAEDSSSASVSGDLPFGLSGDLSGKRGGDEALCLARNAALRLVSRAEQCTFLLSQKLLKRGFDAGVVKTVMRELTAANIVNDGRFSRMWLRSRIVSKADTPRRIVAALRAKGIDRGTASEALQECLDSETERALLGRFIKKRFGDMPFDLNGCRAELRGEGFSQGAIRDFGEAAER
jgi:SOS response regulatory protein OraA/RecX